MPGQQREHRRPGEIAFRHRVRVQREPAELDPVCSGVCARLARGQRDHQVGNRRPRASLHRQRLA